MYAKDIIYKRLESLKVKSPFFLSALIVKLTRFRKIQRDQLTQVTLYNREAKGIRAAEKKTKGMTRLGKDRDGGLKR